jgi:hypothetical protein
MKKYILLLFLTPSLIAFGQPGNQSLKSVLLQQLKSTHNVKDWFVPVNIAVDGLTAGQASSMPKEGNHSVGQLAYHLLFWNERQLKKFKGEKEDPFDGDNTETFDKFSEKQWNDTVKKLDEVLTEIENLVANASDDQLNAWAPTIANISTHNAYHIGEMVYIRKLQGTWDPEKGVK